MSPALAGRFFTISTIWEAPREVPKRPNRKTDVFLQTNKTYSQVHDVASEGGGLDFNLYFHPRANLLNSLGPVWPWVNFLTSMIVLHILGRWMPMRKASGLPAEKFCFRNVPWSDIFTMVFMWARIISIENIPFNFSVPCTISLNASKRATSSSGLPSLRLCFFRSALRRFLDDRLLEN